MAAVKKETKKEVKKTPAKTAPKKCGCKKTETKKVDTKKVDAKKVETKAVKKDEKVVVSKASESKAIYHIMYDDEKKVWSIKKDKAKRIIATFKTFIPGGFSFFFVHVL